MKKILLPSLLMGISMSYGQAIQTIPLYDGFNYSTSNGLFFTVDPVPNNADGIGEWTNVTTSTTDVNDANASADPVWGPNVPTTTDGKAIQFQGAGVKPILKFTPIAGSSTSMPPSNAITSTTNKLYFSFAFQVNDMTLFTNTGSAATTSAGATGQFVQFGSVNSGGTGTSFTPIALPLLRVPVGSALPSTTFNIGIKAKGGGAQTAGSDAIFDVTNYSVGDKLFVVVMYDFGTTKASLWVNPTLSSTEPAALITTNAEPAFTATLNAIRVNQSGNAGTPLMTADEFRVAFDWATVVGAAQLSVVENALDKTKINVYNKQGAFHVNSSNITMKEIQMYDIKGQLVNKLSNINGNNASISNAASNGLHFLRVVANDDKVATFKVMN